MIGDLLGAQDLGMKSCLVLSGKVKKRSVITSYSIHYTKLYDFLQLFGDLYEVGQNYPQK